jgi:hypothetical protein
MQHVPRRVHLHPAESIRPRYTIEYDVPVEPSPSGNERGEADPHMQGDPRLLRQYLDGSEFPHDLQNAVEGGPDVGVAAEEQLVERSEGGAGVGLSGRSEGSPAARARPERTISDGRSRTHDHILSQARRLVPQSDRDNNVIGTSGRCPRRPDERSDDEGAEGRTPP